MNIAAIAAHTESIALIQLTVTAFKNDHFSQPTKQSKVVLCDLLVVAVARSRKHRGISLEVSGFRGVLLFLDRPKLKKFSKK